MQGLETGGETVDPEMQRWFANCKECGAFYFIDCGPAVIMSHACRKCASRNMKFTAAKDIEWVDLDEEEAKNGNEGTDGGENQTN